MVEYRTVEGPVSTVDTLTALTTFANETGVGPIKVPDNARKIAEIWASIGIEIEDSEIQSYGLRLTGKGMKNGDQDFNLGSGSANGTVVQADMNPAIVYHVDIPVKPNENISVQAVVNGSALAADGQFSITLVFA